MCYDTWKTTHPDEYYEKPYEDYVHIDEVAKYAEAADYIKEIIKQIYVTGDIEKLEDQLEELSGVFNLKIPETPPKIQKKRSELFDLCVQLTQDYANSLTSKGEIV